MNEMCVYIFLERERGEGRERKRKRCVICEGVFVRLLSRRVYLGYSATVPTTAFKGERGVGG